MVETNNNKFFLDIFNNILDFNKNKVIIIFDEEGNIWFGLKDIMKMLGYTNIIKRINDMKINVKFKKKFEDLKVVSFRTPPNFQKNTNFVNESGLYEILVKSIKPIAKIFLNKYLIEIMPEIRKTGKYVLNKTDMNKIEKLNDKIENYKKELNYYDDKYQFIPSKYGYLYINEDNQIKNGKNIKCYKIGYDADMEKRIKQYKVGNFNHKLLAYIPLKIDRKQIEKCIKTRLKPHLIKLITDTVCYISLKNLKNEIIDCINFTTEHVCNCVKCSKIYKLNLIDKHKCNLHQKSDIINFNEQKINNIKINNIKKNSKNSKKSSKINNIKKNSKKSSKKKSKKSSKI